MLSKDNGSVNTAPILTLRPLARLPWTVRLDLAKIARPTPSLTPSLSPEALCPRIPQRRRHTRPRTTISPTITPQAARPTNIRPTRRATLSIQKGIFGIAADAPFFHLAGETAEGFLGVGTGGDEGAAVLAADLAIAGARG